MSRIGRKPVELPQGVEARVGEETVKIKGPLGELEQKIPPHVKVVQEDSLLWANAADGTPERDAGAMRGLMRALMANMVHGVTKGYSRSLDLIGVGYRAKGDGQTLTLSLGFTEPIAYQVPDGVSYEIKGTQGQKENQVVLSGIDKALVGQIAADIRRLRPPEPYKGKGIRYSDERIRHKAGKAGAR